MCQHEGTNKCPRLPGSILNVKCPKLLRKNVRGCSKKCPRLLGKSVRGCLGPSSKCPRLPGSVLKSCALCAWLYQFFAGPSAQYSQSRGLLAKTNVAKTWRTMGPVPTQNLDALGPFASEEIGDKRKWLRPSFLLLVIGFSSHKQRGGGSKSYENWSKKYKSKVKKGEVKKWRKFWMTPNFQIHSFICWKLKSFYKIFTWPEQLLPPDQLDGKVFKRKRLHNFSVGIKCLFVFEYN